MGETAREKDIVGVTLKAPKGKSVVYKALALNVHFMSKLLCQTNTASYWCYRLCMPLMKCSKFLKQFSLLMIIIWYPLILQQQDKQTSRKLLSSKQPRQKDAFAKIVLKTDQFWKNGHISHPNTPLFFSFTLKSTGKSTCISTLWML